MSREGSRWRGPLEGSLRSCAQNMSVAASVLAGATPSAALLPVSCAALRRDWAIDF